MLNVFDGRPYTRSGISRRCRALHRRFRAVAPTLGAASVVVVELFIVAFERLTRDFLPRQACIATGAKAAQSEWRWALLGAELGERAEQTVELEPVGRAFS